MNYHEWVDREGEQAATEARRVRSEEMNYGLTAEDKPDVFQTVFDRLDRLQRFERLVTGLERIVLCRPKYGDAAVEEIGRLLKEMRQ